MSAPSAERPRPLQVSWVVGGGLLIASAVVGLVAPQAGIAWLPTASTVLFSAAVVVFALGVPGGGSVTARRAAGTTALLVLALWPPISLVVWAAQGRVLELTPLSSALAYVDMALPLLAGIVGVVAIMRAGVVPSPWNRAPIWALAALVAPNVLTQLLFVAVPQEVAQFAPSLFAFTTLVTAGAPILLGVLALVLAQPPRAPRTPVVVYPPPEEEASR